jgi:hypothetical protein
MSRSNLQRIEPLRKHHQLRVIEGLRQAHESVHVCRTFSLPTESCWWLHFYQQECLRRGIGHVCGCPMLQPADKVVWRYRGTRMPPFSSKEIGDEGAKGTFWGGAAVVLRARESCAHGEGRQCWRVWFQADGRELDP